MKREAWAIANNFAYSIRILNSIFCCKDKEEQEYGEDEKWLVAEQIRSMVSVMMIEDVEEILMKVKELPEDRLCENIDCKFHHSKKPQYCNLCERNKKPRISRQSFNIGDRYSPE